MNKKYNDYLTILSSNLNSLSKRKIDLEDIIKQHNPEVICVQETLTQKPWNPPNYVEIDNVVAGVGFTRLPRGSKT